MPGDEPIGRRAIIRGSFGAGLALGLAGCQSGGEERDAAATTDETTTDETTATGTGTDSRADAPLTVAHDLTGGAAERAMASLVDAFRATHPDAGVEAFPLGGTAEARYRVELDHRLRTRAPLGSFLSRAGDSLSQYRYALADGTESVWQPDDFGRTIDRGVARTCTVDGWRVAVPAGVHRVNTLYYNPTVLRDADVDPADLSSVAAFVEAVRTVAAETDAVAFGQPLKAPWSTVLLVETILLGQAGYDAHRAATDGEPSVPAVRRAFETARTLVTNHVHDDASYIGTRAAAGRLAAGDAAFLVSGSWLGSHFRESNHTYGETWDARPFPGTADSFLMTVRAFCYPVATPSPRSTAEWLRFVGSRAGQTAFNGTWGSVPARTDVPAEPFGPFVTDVFEQFHETAPGRSLAMFDQVGLSPAEAEAAADAIASRFHGETYDVEAATTAFVRAIT